MIINKANWTTDKDNLRLSMPIGKVDVERRMVSGFASLDNIDKQDDIVTADASVKAFKNFKGNLSIVKIYNKALTPEEINVNYKALKGRFIN